jgi:hypothetical protein
VLTLYAGVLWLTVLASPGPPPSDAQAPKERFPQQPTPQPQLEMSARFPGERIVRELALRDQLAETRRPALYAGPFTDPAFEQIRVKLAGVSASNLATWSYGAYFQEHPDAALFQRYYNGTLPVSAAATLTHEPRALGQTAPPAHCSTDGTNVGPTLLALSNVGFSSRYGGTVRLAFKAVDDVGIELRRDCTAWDIRDFTLALYIAPGLAWFNQPQSIGGLVNQGMAGVELRSGRAVQYASSSGNPWAAVPTDAALLGQILNGVAATLRSPLANDAGRFATGLVHSRLQSEIAIGELVDSIAISDNSIVVATHVAEALFSVQWRGGRITAPGYSPVERDYEYEVFVAPAARYCGSTCSNLSFEQLPSLAVDLEGRDMSYWMTLATWRPSDCADWQDPATARRLWGIATEYTVTEKSPLPADRRFGTVGDSFWVYGSCGDILAKAASAQPWASPVQSGYLPLASDPFGGGMTVEYRIVLQYR